VEVCVIRVQQDTARNSKRDPRISWFIWAGSQEIPLEQVRSWYRNGFWYEHGYRFLKQDLLWEQAYLLFRTYPIQAFYNALERSNLPGNLDKLTL
jgi:hypothetical protein